MLRESIFLQQTIDLTTLQRFAGKCISMHLAIPASNLYTREINWAISVCQKKSKSVQISLELSTEIEHWRFVDDWHWHLKWRPESHYQLYLATDASSCRYGVSLLSGENEGTSFGDYWKLNNTRPIHLKEAEAALKALQSLGTEIQNHRVDLLTDNQAVKCAWHNQGGNDSQLNGIMKQIVQLVFEKIDLQMHYIPPKLNPANRPSREVDMMETTLNKKFVREVNIVFAPHYVDIMAS